MKFYISILILLSIVILPAQLLWQNVRNSAPDPDDQIYIRFELVTQHDTWLLSETDSTISQQYVENVEFLPVTFQGYIPAPQNFNRAYGFRSVLIDPAPDQPAVHVAPVSIQNFDQPQYDILSWISDDPAGDPLVDELFLDIIEVLAAFDQNKLYLALKNNGGGFPVSETAWGPFYSYLLLIAPPSEDFITFGMLNTVDQQPIVQPGLYKFYGTGMEDIEMIADIDIIIDQDNDLLILACWWDDLLADPDFTEWFDPDDPRFSLMANTSRITLAGGLEDADNSDTFCIYPHNLVYEVEENIIPVISDFCLTENNLICVTYHDDNANFALSASAVIDDSVSFDLFPQSFEFHEPVIYQSLLSHSSLIDNTWNSILISVTDNNIDYSELIACNDSAIDPMLPDQPDIHINNYPNPFNPTTSIAYDLMNDHSLPAYITIYNIKGQAVNSFTIKDRKSNIIWYGNDHNDNPVSSGIYFYKLQSKDLSVTKKMILLR